MKKSLLVLLGALAIIGLSIGVSNAASMGGMMGNHGKMYSGEEARKILEAAQRENELYQQENMKMYKAKVEEYTKLIEKSPKDSRLYYSRAAYYHAQLLNTKKEDRPAVIEAAKKDIDKAIQLDPKNYVAYSMRADLYCWKENYQAAVDDLTKAINMYPDKQCLYERRALVYDYFLPTNYSWSYGQPKPKYLALKHADEEKAWQLESQREKNEKAGIKTKKDSYSTLPTYYILCRGGF